MSITAFVAHAAQPANRTGNQGLREHRADDAVLSDILSRARPQLAVCTYVGHHTTSNSSKLHAARLPQKVAPASGRKAVAGRGDALHTPRLRTDQPQGQKLARWCSGQMWQHPMPTSDPVLSRAVLFTERSAPGRPRCRALLAGHSDRQALHLQPSADLRRQRHAVLDRTPQDTYSESRPHLSGAVPNG